MGMSFFTNIFFNDIRESFEEPYLLPCPIRPQALGLLRPLLHLDKFAPLDYRVVTMKPIAGQFFAIKLPLNCLP